MLWPNGDGFELSISDKIYDIPVSALADSGPDLGIIPADFTQQNSLPLDSSQRISVRLPTKTIRSRGTITLPFAFDGETSLFDRKFNVVPSYTYDMILNDGFLKSPKHQPNFKAACKPSSLRDPTDLACV